MDERPPVAPAPVSPPDSDAFIARIHEVEEEINAFIARTREEGARLLETARAEAEETAQAGRRGAEAAAARHGEEVLAQARAQAAHLKEEGRRAGEMAGRDSRERKERSVAQVMELVQGKRP